MKLIIHPKHTGLDNYDSQFCCPMAMALRDRGLKSVYVGPTTWRAIKPIKFFGWMLFRVVVGGFVPADTDRKARELARIKQTEPVTVELWRGTGDYFDHPNFKA